MEVHNLRIKAQAKCARLNTRNYGGHGTTGEEKANVAAVLLGFSTKGNECSDLLSALH